MKSGHIRAAEPKEKVESEAIELDNKVVEVSSEKTVEANEPKKRLAKKKIPMSKESKEILDHLKKVMLTSFVCLLILGLIYYFEQNYQILDKFEFFIKNKLLTIFS